MICRMCLSQTQELIRIFDYESVQLNIAGVIAKYFWFEPKAEELTSNCICKPCWAQISSFHSYYCHVEETHRKLSGTCFVKEEVTFDYEADEGRTENLSDMDALPSTSKLWYDEFIDEKGTSSSSSTPKTVDAKICDNSLAFHRSKPNITNRGRPSKRLLEEPFFMEIPNQDDSQPSSMRTISARCLICKNKVIKGQKNVSSNFIKHLKNLHPEMYELYRNSRNDSCNTIRSENNSAIRNENYSGRNENYSGVRNENFNTSYESYQDNKNTKPETYSESSESNQNLKITPLKLNDNIIAFIADAMLPLSIVENPYFVKIFEEFGVEMMGCETFYERLNDNFNVVRSKIKDAIAKNKYFCTTVDVWTYNKKSFFGYTCHWIDDDFNRFSTALAYKRHTGQYSFDKIMNMIVETNEEFGLNFQNIVATVTDNGSNFTHIFTQYGTAKGAPETQTALFNMLNDDIVVPDFLNFNEHPELTHFFPNHCRSASQALNLIPTVDFVEVLKKNAPLYKKHLQIFMKCLQLWEKAACSPKINEMITTIIGKSPGYPLTIRWNSMFDGLTTILQHKEKLPELHDKLKFENFSQDELDYLEEYCLVMRPISECITFLQGEKAIFYGYLIPSLVTLKVKLDKIASKSDLKFLNKELIALRLQLLRRFGHIFELQEEAHDAVVASVTCPSIKFRWLNVIGKTSNKTLEDVKNIVLKYANRISGISQKNVNQPKMEEQDESFFDFGDEDTAVENSTNINLSTVEWELLSYSSDKRTDFEVLKKYPNLMKVFIKYNTVLPSSTLVEKLLSFTDISNAPTKNVLSDENFEKLALLKANMNFTTLSDSIWCPTENLKFYTETSNDLENNGKHASESMREAFEPSAKWLCRVPKPQSHYLKKTNEIQGQRISRNRCRRCYELLVKDKGSAVAKSQTRRVSTFCETCPDKPFLCVDCFKPFHEKGSSLGKEECEE